MTLRAGLIGAGAMGRNHARVLSNLEGVELVAVADPQHATPLNGVPVVPSVSDLLALGIDYAVVACPTVLHEEIGLALAAAGVHALIEKPLAHSPQTAESLTRAFDAAGLIGGVGHIERYNPALQELRKRLMAGELGDIYQVVTRRQGPFPSRISDVGVVMDLATHDIDLTAWITGQHFSTVCAHTVAKSTHPHEDMVVMVGQLDGGIVTNHLVNWLSPFKERSTVVTGERGSFIADTLKADLTFHANGNVRSDWDVMRSFRGVSEGNTTLFALARREPLLVEHENFRDAVLGRENNIVSLSEGSRTVAVATAVLESAKRQEIVQLGKFE